MSHVRDHCKLPGTLFKRTGTVHLCTCGQWWTLQRIYGGFDESIKTWVKIDTPLIEIKHAE